MAHSRPFGADAGAGEGDKEPGFGGHVPGGVIRPGPVLFIRHTINGGSGSGAEERPKHDDHSPVCCW